MEVKSLARIAEASEQKKRQEISSIFWNASAFAIFFVICAHCVYHNSTLQRISDIIGSVGVPIFLIRSGYFFNQKERAGSFWMKKIKTLIVPWLLISPCLYLFSIIRRISAFSVKDAFLYTIGYGTWLYFVMILLLYYLLFRLIRQNWFIYVSIVLFFVSNIVDFYSINPITNISTTYLNPFNRIGYFAIGMLLNHNDLLCRILNHKILAFCGFALFLPVGAVFLWFYDGLAISLCMIFYRLLFTYVVFCAAKQLGNIRWVKYIGKNTYLIFFLHMQFGMGLASALLHLFRVNAQLLEFLIKPGLVLAITVIIIMVLRWTLTRLSLNRFAWVIGLKTD